MERQLTTKRTTARPKRSSLNSRSRLSVRDQDPNYFYRIVNCNLESDPDRIENLLEIGYEIVPQKKAGPVGDAKVDTPSAVGSAGQISVGRGTKAVVMRIPKDWYKEDQAEKQAALTHAETAPKQAADYGTLNFEAKREG